MTIAGIICEYNPFHNGHIYHIQKTKELTQCDILVCVMSGNFVQRGEPAITDKWSRAKTAVQHGVDLVLELPFLYATQSATYFANAAIHLCQLAKVEMICFGSESNDLSQLQKLAQKNDALVLKDGQSPSQAYEAMYGTLLSNDILAINYLKAMQHTTMTPICIQRTNHYLDWQMSGTISSATSIRQAIQNKQVVSHATPMQIDTPIYLKNYYPLIQYLLATLSNEYLSSLFLMDEGIENMLKKNAGLPDFEQFMSACISKRYTRSKIQRTLIHLLNQTTKKQAAIDFPQYLRPLAFNEKGQAYLKQLSQHCVIASKFNQIPQPFREMEYKAAQVVSFAYPNEMRFDILQQELQPPIQCISY